MAYDEALSKDMSTLLRYGKARRHGVHQDSDGYINLEDMVREMGRPLQDIMHVAECSFKSGQPRFELQRFHDIQLIRATRKRQHENPDNQRRLHGGRHDDRRHRHSGGPEPEAASRPMQQPSPEGVGTAWRNLPPPGERPQPSAGHMAPPPLLATAPAGQQPNTEPEAQPPPPPGPPPSEGGGDPVAWVRQVADDAEAERVAGLQQQVEKLEEEKKTMAQKIEELEEENELKAETIRSHSDIITELRAQVDSQDHAEMERVRSRNQQLEDEVERLRLERVGAAQLDDTSPSSAQSGSQEMERLRRRNQQLEDQVERLQLERVGRVGAAQPDDTSPSSAQSGSQSSTATSNVAGTPARSENAGDIFGVTAVKASHVFGGNVESPAPWAQEGEEVGRATQPEEAQRQAISEAVRVEPVEEAAPPHSSGQTYAVLSDFDGIADPRYGPGYAVVMTGDTVEEVENPESDGLWFFGKITVGREGAACLESPAWMPRAFLQPLDSA